MTTLAVKSLTKAYSIGDGLPDKVHYACGLNVWEGWANTDFFDEKSYPGGEFLQDISKNVYFADLSARQPFPDASFSYAYSEDFIEHLMMKDAITFLFEVRRCLKSRGVFRVSTPGFHEVMGRHYAGKQFQDLEHEHQNAFDEWGHYNFFSHETLKSAAMAAGFTQYKICEYGLSEHEVLRGIDTRFGQIGLNIIAELTA